MCFPYPCIPQRASKRHSYDAHASIYKRLIPLRYLTIGKTWNWLSTVEVALPAHKVEYQTEVIPGLDARDACADKLRVRSLNIRVRIPEDGKSLQSVGINKKRPDRRIDAGEQPGKRKILREDGVALPNDFDTNDARVRVDKGAEMAVYGGEIAR